MPNERLIMDVNNSCRAFLAKNFFFFLPSLLLSDAALPPPGIHQKWRFVNMHSTFVGIYENGALENGSLRFIMRVK